jgi:general secretion pathway protein D
MPRNFKASFAGLLFMFAVAANAAEEKVTLNFVNADIESVIRAVGEITGKNFIIDPRVKGTINIISSSPVPRDLTYEILLSALRLQGFAAVEGPGGVTKILLEADAKQNFSPTVDKESRARGDKIITQVYTLKHESAAQLAAILRPLIPPNNTISAYPNTNTLVITDYASNLKRLTKIIESIDQPTGGEIETIRLQHASAVDLAQLLTKLIPESAGAPGAPGSQRFSVVADVRTNALILRSDTTAHLSRAKAIVESLDVPATAAGAIHVVYLRNADAVAIAEILRGLFAGDQKGLLSLGPSGPAGGPTAPGGGPATPPGAPLAPPAPTSAPGSPASIAAGTTPSAPFSPPSQANTGPGLIQADPATNSLIIAASDAVYNTLRGVIEQLDTRRAQVHLEALIAEVSATKAAEFGIQYQNLEGVEKGGTNVIGGTNFNTAPGANITGRSSNITSAGPGLNIGIVDGTINIPGVGEILDLRFLARALETNADANILSTPNLLTMDNEEAKIVVGQNVPFVTGSFAQATGTGAQVNPFQTIERRDVGLTLRIKPQVTEGGSVKLKIFQEVSSVQPSNIAADIITNKRSVESTVLVQDGQIIVLGGLIQDNVVNNLDKVPLLGDIPGLGLLFRYETRTRTKTNLMVFLRPVVLRDIGDAAPVTGSRYDYIRNEQDKSRLPPHIILPNIQVPVLPTLPGDEAPALPEGQTLPPETKESSQSEKKE